MLIIIYLLVFLVFIIGGAILFFRSLKSRKYYICPSCGERIYTEHMIAQRCNVCGAFLKEEKNAH